MDEQMVNVSINGTTYQVEVGDLSAEVIQVRVNGRVYEVKIQPDPATTNSKTGRAEGIPAPQDLGEAKTRPQIQVGTLPGVGSEVRAPMPGTILEVSVKAGEAVRRGQQLCILEAMKMKSAIRSPRDGMIRSIEVAEGMKVAFRDPLFWID